MKKQVVLDFETYFDPQYSLTKLTTPQYINHRWFKVWGVGIKHIEINDYMGITEHDTDWYGEHEAKEAIHSIDWANTELICHNTLFDGYILTQHYGVTPSYYFDTAAQARGLFPGQSARLADVVERLFPDDLTKRKGKELVNAKGEWGLNPDLEDEIAGYCIQDVNLTYDIFCKMDMPQSEYDLINLTTRMFCEPTLVVDRERLIAYKEEEAKKSEVTIALCGVEREILSSNQKFSALLEEMDITVPTKISPTTGKSIPALGKNDPAFKQLQAKYRQHKPLWKARIAIKSRIAETRAQRFIDATHDDGTISVPLRYYAAHTGRFGGTDKINMQNLPRGSELRRVLMAPKDHYLYIADLSNIEARMLAWLAGEDKLLTQFRNGSDIYSNFASEIYGKDVNKNDHPKERFVGKTAILGLGYGMGAKKFAMTLSSGAAGPGIEFSDEEAVKVVSLYRTTYSRIPFLWKKTEDLLLQTLNPNSFGNTYGPLTVGDKALILPNGMALKYPELSKTSDGFLFRSGKQYVNTYGGKITENIIQALARIIITDSMLRLDKEYNVVLTVHDEIIISGTKVNPHATMENIIDDMRLPPVWAADLPLDAEGGFDTRYSK
mgnify:CR=1 FL=1|tara:strand:+ start:304 stop:2127 length:1824 start_codon:yes stop_codon:yes gene_type:complete